MSTGVSYELQRDRIIVPFLWIFVLEQTFILGE